MKNITKHQQVKKIFDAELSLYNLSTATKEKWLRLERLHILGQLGISLHYHSHFLMLRQAFQERNVQEIAGQIVRLLLVAPGHLFNSLPKGNVGTTRVNPFTPMNIPDDFKDYFKL